MSRIPTSPFLVRPLSLSHPKNNRYQQTPARKCEITIPAECCALHLPATFGWCEELHSPTYFYFVLSIRTPRSLDSLFFSFIFFFSLLSFLLYFNPRTIEIALVWGVKAFSKETATCVGVGWVSLSPVPRSELQFIYAIARWTLCAFRSSACCLSACLLAILESTRYVVYQGDYSFGGCSLSSPVSSLPLLFVIW